MIESTTIVVAISSYEHSSFGVRKWSPLGTFNYSLKEQLKFVKNMKFSLKTAHFYDQNRRKYNKYLRKSRTSLMLVRIFSMDTSYAPSSLQSIAVTIPPVDGE